MHRLLATVPRAIGVVRRTAFLCNRVAIASLAHRPVIAARNCARGLSSAASDAGSVAGAPTNSTDVISSNGDGISPLLDRLSAEQRATVAHGTGPLLVLAGPGTGKTYTLAARVAHLIVRERVPSHEIAGTCDFSLFLF